MLNHIFYICLALAFIGIAIDEVTGCKIRHSKYSRLYSTTLIGLAVVSVVSYVIAVIVNHASLSEAPLSALFLYAFPFINILGRRMQNGSSGRMTCYWVLIFVSIIAIAVRLFGY